MTQTAKLSKELFTMVYAWGKWNLVVDHKAPAYRRLVKKLIASQLAPKKV